MKLLKANNEAYKVFCIKYNEDEESWKFTFNLISKDINNFVALELSEYNYVKNYHSYNPVTFISFYYYAPNNTITQLLNETTNAATMLLNKTDIQILKNKLIILNKLYKAFKKL